MEVASSIETPGTSRRKRRFLIPEGLNYHQLHCDKLYGVSDSWHDVNFSVFLKLNTKPEGTIYKTYFFAAVFLNSVFNFTFLLLE
jgi:hypothetical protein